MSDIQSSEPAPPQTIKSDQNSTKALVISSKKIVWLDELDQTAYEVERVETAEDGMEQLSSGNFDIILIDDDVLKKDTATVAREIKRRVPIVPVLVLSSNSDQEYQTDLIEAGVDDILTQEAPSETLLRRFRLLLRQRRQNLALARRNQNLHSITMVSRRLHNADHPASLIVDAINTLCTAFSLYGVAIAINQGDTQKLYAGTAGVNDNRRLYESAIPLHNYDPFLQCIRSGMSQIYRDLNTHPFYTPIPVLPDTHSAIIVPLTYGEQILGALAVFNTHERSFSPDELMLYELLAGHLGSAYYNVRQYYAQDVNYQSARQTLRAWQRLTTVYKPEEVASSLCELVQDTRSVNNALVWLFDTREDAEEIITNTSNDDVADVFKKLYEDGHITRILEQFDNRMQPLSFLIGRGQDPLNAMFRVMGGQQLLLIPVVGSLQLLGGVFVTNTVNMSFSTEDINLMESLTHAAGQTLERNTLITAMEEQTGRLEAILRSIKEGIFFVGGNNRVVFCNPQFTEVTGIPPSQVLSYESDTLLDQLASKANNPDLKAQLQEALKQTIESDEDTHEYPIVETYLEDTNQNIYIEFMAITSHDAKSPSWIGFLRTSKQGSGIQSQTQQLLRNIIEGIGVPYTQLHSSIITLNEHHGNLSYRKREQYMTKLEEEADAASKLWSNFIQIYNVETAGLVLDREAIDPYELIDDLLNSRSLSKYRRRVHVNVQPPRVNVEVDVRYIRIAITNIIEFIAWLSPSNSPINIQVKPQKNSVSISIQDKSAGLSAEDVDTLFDPMQQNQLDSEYSKLGLYLSNRIIEKHNGELDVESRPGWGTVMKLVLPTVGSTPVSVEKPFSVTVQSQQPQPLSVIVVEGRKSILSRLYDRIEQEEHKIIIEHSAREVLSDLGLAHFDLILLDQDANDNNVVGLCRDIRQQSDIPIIVVADHDNEEERVQALRTGADDYVVEPFSEDEFLARMDSIAKRKLIVTRTQPPMQIGDIYIDFARRLVYVNNNLLDLTTKEYELLRTLALHKEQVLTHKQLLEKVWGPEYREETQYLWVNVSRLRKKLEPTKESPRYIQTEPGIGYVFREP
ncbi:MAG: hypothetical protein CL607_16395 [Anaerolineaceae bacterium]|nr:hypothetical protein [Anaerolineaceae bacterium]